MLNADNHAGTQGVSQSKTPASATAQGGHGLANGASADRSNRARKTSGHGKANASNHGAARGGHAGPLEYQTSQDRMNILGFWIFLGAEIVLFATLFGVYGVLFDRYAGGPTHQDIIMIREVLIQTVLLLTSSFTCGIAIYEMRRGNVRGLIAWLLITVLLGAGFLVMEVNEFLHYIHIGATMQTSAFLSSLFVLLGTHGAHVTVGIGWVIMIIMQLKRHGLTPITARKTFIIGLYWHFLDVVWIFIFTFVYLKGLVI